MNQRDRILNQNLSVGQPDGKDGQSRSSAAVRMPTKRADCQNIARPCQFVQCRYNLRPDQLAGKNRVRLPMLSESCALDVAESGEHELHEIGDILGISDEAVRQIETQAMKKLHSRYDRSIIADFVPVDDRTSMPDHDDEGLSILTETPDQAETRRARMRAYMQKVRSVSGADIEHTTITT